MSALIKLPVTIATYTYFRCYQQTFQTNRFTLNTAPCFPLVSGQGTHEITLLSTLDRKLSTLSQDMQVSVVILIHYLLYVMTVNSQTCL